nr:hypothetical protein [Tanacetum cinerariifolium]
MGVLLAKERTLKLIQVWDEKQIKLWSFPKLLPQLLNDSRTIDEMLKQREQATNLAVQQEHKELTAQSFTLYWNFSMIEDEERSIQYKEYFKNSSNAITPVLPIEEPEYSLSMGDKHLSTILETKSDEVIKSSVNNLVQIPSEYEVTSDNESECDVPICEDSFDVLKDHPEIYLIPTMMIFQVMTMLLRTLSTDKFVRGLPALFSDASKKKQKALNDLVKPV